MRQTKNRTNTISIHGSSFIECRAIPPVSDSTTSMTNRHPYFVVNGSPRGENADYTIGQHALSSRGDTLTAESPPGQSLWSRTAKAVGPPRRLSFEEILQSVLQSESGEIVQRAF